MIKHIVVFMLVFVSLWLIGFVRFVDTLPPETKPPSCTTTNTRTDAIVVITGGRKRFRTGLQLLSQNCASQMFISGVNPKVSVQDMLKLVNFGTNLKQLITLGYQAQNTRENAIETSQWIQQQQYTSLRLVTAHYHMSRSLLEFRQVMPEINIVPHIVAPFPRSEPRWWQNKLDVLAHEYNKYIITSVYHSLRKFYVATSSTLIPF